MDDTFRTGGIIKTIYNACDPAKPAGAYYHDCSEARGSGVLTQVFLRHLELANDHLCLLFSGHLGCGKSSELEALRQRLADPQRGNERYFPVLINITDYLDDYDAAPIDILLAIVTEIAATLRDKEGIELKDNYFLKRLNEIKGFFLSDVEINEGELELGAAKIKIQRLKRDPTARQRVRDALLPQMTSLQEEINQVFEEARLALKKVNKEGEPPYKDIVLILDNLEKIQRIAGKEEGLASQRELFLERAPQLTGMQVHVVYTVPLRLVRSAEGPKLEQLYGPLIVLPMIKVIQRGRRKPFDAGRDCLRALIQKRLEGSGCSVDSCFDRDALEFLLTYSGGHPRNLMMFIQSVCTYSETIPFSLPAAHKAIQQTVRAYSTSIPDEHWEKLAKLDIAPDEAIPGGDGDYLAMLHNLSVLEYLNGGEEDAFGSAEPWYAVNPIVRELKKFKAALLRLQDTASG